MCRARMVQHVRDQNHGFVCNIFHHVQQFQLAVTVVDEILFQHFRQNGHVAHRRAQVMCGKGNKLFHLFGERVKADLFFTHGLFDRDIKGAAIQQVAPSLIVAVRH